MHLQWLLTYIQCTLCCACCIKSFLALRNAVFPVLFTCLCYTCLSNVTFFFLHQVNHTPLPGFFFKLSRESVMHLQLGCVISATQKWYFCSAAQCEAAELVSAVRFGLKWGLAENCCSCSSPRLQKHMWGVWVSNVVSVNRNRKEFVDHQTLQVM